MTRPQGYRSCEECAEDRHWEPEAKSYQRAGRTVWLCDKHAEGEIPLLQAKWAKEAVFDVSKNYKRAGTSSIAAHKAHMRAKLGQTHKKILAELAIEPRTADELSRDLGLVLNTARARCSDLRNPRTEEGVELPPFICPTGERRETDAGELADVLRITTPQERAEWSALEEAA